MNNIRSIPIALLVMLTGITDSSARFDWTWRTQLPQNQSLSPVIWTGTQFATVGGFGVFLTSTDGTEWTVRDLPVKQNTSAIIWNGKQYIVTGDRGRIETSPDGVTWTIRDTSASKSAPSLAWDGGSRYIALGDSCTLRISPDAIDWKEGNFGTECRDSSDFRSVAFAQGKWMAVGRTGIISSLDGKTWSSVHRFTESGNKAISIFWAGNQWFAFGFGIQLTSPDGVAWTDHYDSLGDGRLQSVVWTGKSYFAVGEKGIWSSVDGHAWTLKLSVKRCFSITYSGNRLVAVGFTGLILNSTDGENWITIKPVAFPEYHSLIWTGKLAVAVGEDGEDSLGNNGVIMTSSDGIAWTNMRVRRGLKTAFSAGGRIFVSDGIDTVYTSIDGVHWSPSCPMKNFTMNSVTWTGNLWAAVGEEYDSSSNSERGVVLTSPDAKTWTDQNLGRIPSIRSIDWADNLLVAVGDSGSRLTSSDGITWRVSNPGSTTFLSNVLWANGQWVVCAWNGFIETSGDALHWERHFPSTDENLYSISWTGKQFVALGGAHFFTSPDGVSWTPRDFPNVKAVYGLVWMGDKLAMLSLFGAILTSPEDVSIAIAQMQSIREDMIVRFDADRLAARLPGSLQNQAIHFSIHDLRGNEVKGGASKSIGSSLDISVTGMRNGWYVLKVNGAKGSIAQPFRYLQE